MPTLHWIGKEKVVSHHHDVPFKILNHKYTFGKPAGNSSPASENKIIHGDNLEALKALLPQYEGKVNCIYIDPPYNTGNENWVYNDNVSDPRLKRWLGQVVGKESEDLSRHDKWLCMMYPRLVLLHKLLAKDGAIFISIDDNEQSSLKLICDEVFGRNNFIASTIWQHSIQAKNDVNDVSLHHNYTIIYKKNDFRLRRIDRTEEHNVAYSNPDNDPNGAWRAGDVRSPNFRQNLKYEIETPCGNIIFPPEKGWRWEQNTLQEKLASKEIIFSKDEKRIIRKIYLNNQSGRVPESIWFGDEVETTRDANRLLKKLFDTEIPFNTPKPTKLLEKIISLSTSTNSIILDSFAGSGTTAHAVLNLNKQDGGNRKFILIEMEDYAESITAERVKRVINGYAGKDGTGGNFSYYELGEPLFKGENSEYLNEAVGADKIRSYIWYSETRSTLTCNCENDQPFLGIHNHTAYYFFYHPQYLTSLDFDTLSIINEQAGQYIIYADNCLIPKNALFKYNIVFKKIPRDISRF